MKPFTVPPDIYLVAPMPAQIDMGKDQLNQVFCFEQRQEILLLLHHPRIICMTPAFVIIHATLFGELIENGRAMLEQQKAQGAILAYRVIAYPAPKETHVGPSDITDFASHRAFLEWAEGATDQKLLTRLHLCGLTWGIEANEIKEELLRRGYALYNSMSPQYTQKELQHG